MATQRLQTKFGLHYHQYGEGPPKIVFVHGIFGSGRNWGQQLKFVNDHFFMVAAAPDQRGQGQSQGFEDKLGMQALVDDLVNFIINIARDAVHLIGHSLGGKVAMMLAAQKPELVKNLMIVDTGLEPLTREIFIPLEWMKNMPVPMPCRREARSYFDQHTQDQRLRNFLLTNIIKFDDGYRWRLDLEGLTQVVEDLTVCNLHSQWQKISCPIYLVRGKNSDHLLAEEAEKMMAIHANAKYVEIEEAGHWCHADQPEVFSKIIQEFLVVP